MVPLSLYCLKCGFPLHMLRQQDDGIDDTIETDEGSLARVQGLTKDLMNSISLKLWSIDLLREGTIDEEHFNRLFEGYQARSVQCMGRRKLMLARCACRAANTLSALSSRALSSAAPLPRLTIIWFTKSAVESPPRTPLCKLRTSANAPALTPSSPTRRTPNTNQPFGLRFTVESFVFM